MLHVDAKKGAVKSERRCWWKSFVIAVWCDELVASINQQCRKQTEVEPCNARCTQLYCYFACGLKTEKWKLNTSEEVCDQIYNLCYLSLQIFQLEELHSRFFKWRPLVQEFLTHSFCLFWKKTVSVTRCSNNTVPMRRCSEKTARLHVSAGKYRTS
jgi:hypothetical protein